MKQVLLLRGINVGGHGKLPMADLRAILTGLGAEDVKTYIQSGNAVFSGALGAGQITDAIEAKAGFRPPAILLTENEFSAIQAANPFVDAAMADPKSVHAWICDGPPAPMKPETLALATSETVKIHGNTCYLHAPDGIGRSKLAAKLDKVLGRPTTARNWRSVEAIAALLDAL